MLFTLFHFNNIKYKLKCQCGLQILNITLNLVLLTPARHFLPDALSSLVLMSKGLLSVLADFFKWSDHRKFIGVIECLTHNDDNLHASVFLAARSFYANGKHPKTLKRSKQNGAIEVSSWVLIQSTKGIWSTAQKAGTSSPLKMSRLTNSFVQLLLSLGNRTETAWHYALSSVLYPLLLIW